MNRLKGTGCDKIYCGLRDRDGLYINIQLIGVQQYSESRSIGGGEAVC